MRNGFFVPNSISDNYVSTQRTAEGDYRWDKETNRVKLNQQAGLQTLSKQYNTTIDAAYSNYLLANRGIRGSQMGQGYKEAYMQEAQLGLQEGLVQNNLNAANVRGQLADQSTQAINDLRKQFESEVGDLDRVSESLNSYYDYLKGLTNKTDPTKSYFTDEEKRNPIEAMYNPVMRAQPIDYLDAEGNIGISYMDWVQKNLKDTERDRAWGNWLINSGGYRLFKDAVSKGIKSQ